MKNLIQVGEVARMLRVHRNTLVRWEQDGQVAPLRGPGGTRYYRAEDVERLRKWREPKPANPHGGEQTR